MLVEEDRVPGVGDADARALIHRRSQSLGVLVLASAATAEAMWLIDEPTAVRWAHQ